MRGILAALKRKWWLVALAGAATAVVAILALVALAPTLVSSGMGRGLIESRIGEAVNGTARIGSLSLSWFGQQRVTGLQIRDGKGETDIRVDVLCENALFDLLMSSVDSIRVTVAGSVQAQVLPGGGTSLSNLASGAGSTPKPSAPSAPSAPSGNPLAALRFPVKVTIGGFDLVLTQAQATAFAVRGLKGSVAIGRDEPLAIDLSATTQVGDRSGSLAVKGALDHFIDANGALDLQGMSGEFDAQVSGWLAALSGVNAEVQAAAVRVQAPAGKPIGVAVNAAVTLDGSAMTAQAQMAAARPAAGRDLVGWATDPRTWTGQVAIKGVPTVPLQRFVANTPLVLTRDLGPTIDLSLSTGEGAGVDLSATSAHMQLVARATVDPTSGAMQGNGITLQATIDPALLASMGTTVDAPVQVSASLASLRTPPITAAGGFDASGIAFDGSVQVQPFQMLNVGPQPIAFGGLTMSAKADTIGTQVDASIRGSVQQAPIDVQMQVTGLGASLAVASAQARGTIAAGPIDPTVLPALPAAARKWLGLVQPGATTVRASLAGSMQQGGAQAQVDMVPGSVALKTRWTAETIEVEQVQSTLTLQPALVAAVAGDSLALSAPTQAKLSAGPVRMARSGAQKFEAIPVSVEVPSIAVAKAPGLTGAASVQDVRVQGSLDPDGPTLFDGSVSIAGLGAAGVNSLGPVQVQSVAVRAKLPSDFSAVAITATVADVQCPRVPGLSGLVGVRGVEASLTGPIDLGTGANASFKGALHDATGTIATVQGTFEPQGSGWRASVQSSDVDMRRALTLAGQGEALPEWVGASGQRSLAANVAGGPGGMSFGVSAALDPISLQAQGTRSAAGAIALTKGSLQAKLPAGVVRTIVERFGTPITGCDPMQVAVTVNALTLPVDAKGALQPFAAGADIDMLVRLEPWRISTKDSPTLAFGANELLVKSKAGTGASVKLTGSLGAEGTQAAPLSVLVQTANLLDAQGKFAPGAGSVAVKAQVKDFPTGLADRVAEMDGYLIDMLGPTFTVDLEGRSGKARDEFFKATFTSPTLTVNAPVVRLADMAITIAADAPLTAELRPDERFRQRILRPVNPFLADMRTVEGRPIRATVPTLTLPLPVDVAAVSTTFTVDVGEVELQKSSQFLGIMDFVKSSQGSTVPGLVSPLAGTLSNGLLTYRDFKVQVGRLGKAGWQQTLFSDARINLAASPAVAEPITIRYPASSITNVLAKIPGMRSVLGKINNVLGGANETIQQAAQVKVSFTGPLDGSELKMTVSPEIDLGKDVGGTIQGIEKGIGGALDDLFGKKK
jgi:hypothetical protein